MLDLGFEVWQVGSRRVGERGAFGNCVGELCAR